jgi:RNA polymerase-binding transcription factor DksA
MAKSNSKKPEPKGSKAAPVRPAALKAKSGKAAKPVVAKQKAQSVPAPKAAKIQKPVKPAAKIAAKAVVKKPAKPVGKGASPAKLAPKSKSSGSKPAKVPAVAVKTAEVKPPAPVRNGKKSGEKPAPKTPPDVVTPAKAKPLPVSTAKAPLKPVPVAPRKGTTTTVIPENAPVIKKPAKPLFPASWVESQRERILELRDSILESMHGVAQDTLRSRAEGSEASAFGMHQADAGSDAYDRDFALSLLSQEQDSLYEIEEALKRIQLGTYGICEISGKTIPVARLEARPFARYTVECQEEVERQGKMHRARLPVTSLFGLTDEEGQESEEEEAPTDTKE